jgi:tyrosyl-tRNA synthetase
MERLNLTLDEGTSGAIARYARRERKPRAALARELIREAIARREALEAQRKLARDYAAGRSDAKEILNDMEAAQLELLDREDA